MAQCHQGSCLCGGVQYQVTGELRGVVNCYCEQCRKTSGHHVAASSAKHSDFELLKTETLAWYRSSNTAERGFCQRCGGNLFWQPDGESRISIMAGTLNQPTGLTTVSEMYVDEANDYITR